MNHPPPSTSKLDPILEGVKKTFRLDEEFRTFLDRNQDVKDSKPDVGFLLFLVEQQRMAIINLEDRLTRLEKMGSIYCHSKPYSASIQNDKSKAIPYEHL